MCAAFKAALRVADQTATSGTDGTRRIFLFVRKKSSPTRDEPRTRCRVGRQGVVTSDGKSPRNCAGVSLETGSSPLSELGPITEQVKRQKQALGEFVQRCYEMLRELAIPRQTLRGACQRYER